MCLLNWKLACSFIQVDKFLRKRQKIIYAIKQRHLKGVNWLHILKLSNNIIGDESTNLIFLGYLLPLSSILRSRSGGSPWLGLASISATSCIPSYNTCWGLQWSYDAWEQCQWAKRLTKWIKSGGLDFSHRTNNYPRRRIPGMPLLICLCACGVIVEKRIALGRGTWFIHCMCPLEMVFI